MDYNGIKHILTKVNYSESNGKLERLNYTIKSLGPYFSICDEVVYHYNHERMHESLSDGDNIVIPTMAYKNKMVVK